MRNILFVCLVVLSILFIMPPVFAASSNFDMDIRTLDDTSTITEIAITKGNNKTIRIDLPKVNSAFEGTVNLEISGLPTGMEPTFSSTSISDWQGAGSTQLHANLTLEATTGAPTGDHIVTIKAVKSNDTTDFVQKTITLYISDFDISTNLGNIELTPGKSEDIIITVSSKQDGDGDDSKFSGEVELLPVSLNGGTIEFIGSINVPEGGTDTAIARVTIDNDAVPNGDGVNVEIYGKVGDLENFVTIKIKILTNPLFVTVVTDPITNPPMAVIFQPRVLSVTVEDSSGNSVVDASITFTKIGGNGTFENSGITITKTTDGSGKATATFTAKSKESVVISVDAVKTNYVSGSYQVELTIKGGILLSVDPISELINAGDSKLITVNIQSLDGFSSPIELSFMTTPPQPGIQVTFSENQLTPEANGQASTTMTVFIEKGLGTGQYPIEIKGTSTINGEISSSASLSITVPIAEFKLSVTPEEITAWQNDKFELILRLESIGGFDGTVQLQETVPEGITVDFEQKSVPLSPVGENSIKFVTVTITTTTDAEPTERAALMFTGTSVSSTGSAVTTRTWLELKGLFEVTIDATSRIDGTKFVVIWVTDETGNLIRTIQPSELPWSDNFKEGDIIKIKIDKGTIDEDEVSRWVFKEWQEDKTTSLEQEVIIDGPKLFFAEFEKEFSINIRTRPIGSMAGMVNIQGSGWHKEGSTAILTTDEILIERENESRYRFDKWDGSITTNEIYVELLVDGPKVIYAEYVKQYKVTKIIEPPFLADIVTTFDDGWLDQGTELYLQTPKRADEYGFLQWLITGDNINLLTTANPTTIFVTQPLTIRVQYDLLPIVKIESIRMPSNGFEGENSQMWVKLSNSELRGGYVVIRVSTNINGLILGPTEEEIFLAPNEVKIFAVSMNYTRPGNGSIDIMLEKTGSSDNEVSTELKIFSISDKRQVINTGLVLSAKYLPQINEWMVPNEKVRICSSEILEQARISDDAAEIDKTKAILQFVVNKIQPTYNTPKSASALIEDFGIIGCINNEEKIIGDTRTYQILLGSLLKSLDIEVRPVIGVMGISSNMDAPSAMMNTWIEVKLDDEWTIIDPINNIIVNEINKPTNINQEINYRQMYANIPENGGILYAMIYDCISICNVDITKEYSNVESSLKVGSILFVDGDVNIEVQDSNRNFIANGTTNHYKWIENDENEMYIKLIILSEGVDLEYILMKINGQLGKEFELNGMRMINFEPQIKTIKSTLLSKTTSEFKLLSIENDFVLAEFISLEYNNRQIEILSTTSLINQIQQERLNAFQITTTNNQNNNELIIFKIPNSILSDIDSDSSKIIIIMNGKQIPVEIIDDGVLTTITIDNFKNTLQENLISIYLKSYDVNIELRDPLNQIIKNADITMIGEFVNITKISDESVFTKLIPGKYEFTIEYRGEQETISRRINNNDVDVQMQLYRSDSMIVFIISAIFAIIVTIAYTIQKAFLRILPGYTNGKNNIIIDI